LSYVDGVSNGFELKISDIDVRVRRCYGADTDDEQIIELTIETFEPAWFLSSLNLTTEQATLISSALLYEATTPLPRSDNA
jgi:hypothetical protein